MWYVVHFFTFWSLIFVLLHPFTNAFVDLKYLSFVVLLVGSYMSFIRPGKFVMVKDDGQRIEYIGWRKWIWIDAIMHLGVFAFVHWIYWKKPFDICTFLLAHILLLIYMSVVDVENVYGISFNEIFCVFIVTNVLFSLFVIKRYR